MKPPRLPEEPPDVLRDADLRAILAACERDKGMAGRRDEAILRCFVDTGAGRAEVLDLTIPDVDLDAGLLRVTGKGSRTRFVAIGAQTVRALDRYRRGAPERVGQPICHSHRRARSRGPASTTRGAAGLGDRLGR